MWKIYAASGRTYLLIVEADRVLPYYNVKFNRYFFFNSEAAGRTDDLRN